MTLVPAKSFMRARTPVLNFMPRGQMWRFASPAVASLSSSTGFVVASVGQVAASNSAAWVRAVLLINLKPSTYVPAGKSALQLVEPAAFFTHAVEYTPSCGGFHQLQR